MDTLTLREMDQQADRTIAKWTFAGLVANLLPPPFDYMAVGAVFARMGMRLADIYEVEVTWATIRTLGAAIAAGCGAPVAAFLVASGWAKWVPVVNLWVGLLVQPPVVAAIAYATGHAFKEYFRAQIEGRVLTIEQVSDLATATLKERLQSLKRPRENTSAQELVQHNDFETFISLPYRERQLILVSSNRHDPYKPAKYRNLKTLTVEQGVAGQLSFPPGHPREKVLYTGHPTVRTQYYPTGLFHRSTFEHKFWEAVRMLVSLGATHMKVQHVTGWSTEFAAQMTIPPSVPGLQTRLNSNVNRGSSTLVLLEADLPDNRSLSVPDDVVWYSSEDSWQAIADARLYHGMKAFSLTLSYQDDFGINSGLKVAAGKDRLELGSKFEDYQATIWHIVGTFW